MSGFKDIRFSSVNSTTALCGLKGTDVFCKGNLVSRQLPDWTFIRGGVSGFFEGDAPVDLIVRSAAGNSTGHSLEVIVEC